jgi:hypothetical protein
MAHGRQKYTRKLEKIKFILNGLIPMKWFE